MYRRGTIVAVAALAVVALVFVGIALDRDTTLTNVAAVVQPSFPPAVSATSVPVASSSAAGSAPASASAASIAPSPSPSSSAPARPVVAFLGDDFTAGVGATAPANRWSSLVAEHYGWDEKNFGVAGTGYATGGTAGGTPYTARIAALAATAPGIVIVAGGRFDIESANGPTKIKAGVTATFTALRAALPKAVIVAESPVWPLTKPPATLALVAADVKAAVIAVGGRYLDVDEPLFGLAADVGPHSLPTDAGHAALAKAFETAFGG
jgi:GDSL-like Lipase/Acylhydrolase family